MGGTQGEDEEIMTYLHDCVTRASGMALIWNKTEVWLGGGPYPSGEPGKPLEHCRGLSHPSLAMPLVSTSAAFNKGLHIRS